MSFIGCRAKRNEPTSRGGTSRLVGGSEGVMREVGLFGLPPTGRRVSTRSSPRPGLSTRSSPTPRRRRAGPLQSRPGSARRSPTRGMLSLLSSSLADSAPPRRPRVQGLTLQSPSKHDWCRNRFGCELFRRSSVSYSGHGLFVLRIFKDVRSGGVGGSCFCNFYLRGHPPLL